jgi:hypothetical protein
MLTQAMHMPTISVDVVASANGGHPPEFWANRAAQKIVQVSDTAPPVIAEQARAFQKQVEQVILYYMKQAIECDRSTVASQLLQG